MRPRSGILPVLGALLSVLPLLPFPEPIRVLSALLSVFIAWPLAAFPLWVRMIPGDPVSGERSAATGAAAFLLLTMVPPALLTALGLFGVPLSTLVLLGRVLTIATALVSFVPGLGKDARGSRLSRGGDLALAASPALVIAALAVLHGSPLGMTDDAFDHLATLRHMVRENRVDFPGAFYASSPPSGQDPRKGALLAGLAMTAASASADPLSVWRLSAVCLGPLMVLAYAALALALFRKRVPALAATIALVLAWGDPHWLLRGAYGGHWGLSTAWAGTALVVSGAGFGWGAVAGLVAASVHAYAPFQLLLPLSLLFLPGCLSRSFRIVSGRALVGAAAGALPLLIARKMLAGPSANALHHQAMGWLVLPAGTVASPLQLLSWYGYPGVAALFAVLVVIFLRRDRAGVFALASALTPLLFLFNPWVFPVVSERLGSVGNKVALAWAYPLAMAWIGAVFVSERGSLRRALVLLASVPLLVSLGVTLPWRVPALLAGPPPLSVSLVSAMKLVDERVPPGGVVASDPLTSYAVPALTGRRTIVTLHQHSPPGDGRALDRMEIAAELYSSCVPLSRALARAAGEGADYLLVMNVPSFRVDQYGAHSDPRNSEVLESRFHEGAAGLEPVGETNGSSLYRLRSLSTADSLPEAGPGGLDFPEVPAVPEARVSDGIVSLAVQSLPLKTARRGTLISLPAAWRLERPPDGYAEYLGHVRFDNDNQPKDDRISFISKPLRRMILEPRAGGSFRWSGVEMPFRGLCPVASWPVGRWLPDTLEVSVPGPLVPGSYTVRIGLEKGTLYPVLHPADLLMDQDRYSGPVIGHLEIE